MRLERLLLVYCERVTIGVTRVELEDVSSGSRHTQFLTTDLTRQLPVPSHATGVSTQAIQTLV